EAQMQVMHPHANLDVAVTARQTSEGLQVGTDSRIRNFCPQLFGLTKALADEHFDADIKGNILIHDKEHIQGTLTLDSLSLLSMNKPRHNVGRVEITSHNDQDTKHISLKSQPLDAQVDGVFQWSRLGNSFQGIAHHYLPDFVGKPSSDVNEDEMTFRLAVQDTVLVNRLAGINLSLPRKATIHGQVDSRLLLVNTTAKIPEIHYAGQHLADLTATVQTTQDVIHTTLDGERIAKNSAVSLHSELYANSKQVHAQLKWDNQKLPSQSGNISFTGTPYKDAHDKQAFRVQIEPSQLIINDTVWYVRPSEIDYHGGKLDVNNLGAYTQDRHLNISGTASKSLTDTLTVDLGKINISYILGIVNFHSVEFAGDATGRVYASALFDMPKANAFLHIHNFTFNDAPLGNMDVFGNYGDHGKSIYLDANIQDVPNDHQTRVLGTVTPGEGPGTGLELNVRTRRFNLAFILPFSGYFVYCGLKKVFKVSPGAFRDYVCVGIASYVGVNVAALAAGVQFGLQPLLFHTPEGQALYCPYPLSISVLWIPLNSAPMLSPA
ncbi:MAG: hypothetical protein HUK03_09725, partial [Bacteroidaceae bacterium]|nr:hypothetical protein [Bacteroidaceae bacterium]